MKRAVLRFTLGSLLLLVGTGGTRADTVKLRGKPAFRNVHITSFRNGRLVFKGVSRQYLRKPLDQIEWVEIDRVPALGRAEHARAGQEWTTAIRAYRQGLDQARKPWLAELARLRLVECCDQAGFFDEAVALYAELVRDDPTLAAEYAPRRPGPSGSSVNRAARRHLEAALASSHSATAASRLRNLLLELALYDEIEDWPVALANASSPNEHQGGGPADSQPANAPPSSAPTSPRLTTPLRLPPDSFLLTAARATLTAGESRRAVRLLKRSLPYVDPADRGPWKLLLGRCRIELGEHAQAVADLVAVAESDPDPERAAEALYYVGLAHERMDQLELAARLYRELLARKNVPTEIRAEAQAGLRRVGEQLWKG